MYAHDKYKIPTSVTVCVSVSCITVTCVSIHLISTWTMDTWVIGAIINIWSRIFTFMCYDIYIVCSYIEKTFRRFLILTNSHLIIKIKSTIHWESIDFLHITVFKFDCFSGKWYKAGRPISNPQLHINYDTNILSITIHIHWKVSSRPTSPFHRIGLIKSDFKHPLSGSVNTGLLNMPS
jgi:hypothetical protein